MCLRDLCKSTKKGETMMELMQLKREAAARAKEHNTKDRELRIRCLAAVEERADEETALSKVMDYLRLYDKDFTPYIWPDLCLAGTPGYFRLPSHPGGLVGDIGHFCADYKKMVDEGVEGIREEILRTSPGNAQEETVRQAYLETLNLFVSYMEKHAALAEQLADSSAEGGRKENLQRMATDIRYICSHRPATFLQGMQLLLFTHSYIFVKPHTDTITFGNLDRVMGTLYQSEREAGTLTREKALEIICHFYLSLEGMDRDTQNIVLSGSAEDGTYFENDLTVLFLEAQERLHLEQPSVSLKIRHDTSDAVWDAALSLLSRGGGMPSFLNDALYSNSLKLAGFSDEEANTFCNVGCYEATPYGNTFGGTVSGNVRLVALFADFFALQEEYESFESFLEAWEAYLKEQYLKICLPSYAKRREEIYFRSASPFLGLVMDGCIENLKLPEQFGAKNNIFSVLFGGLGTVTDSLLCVKHFVYDTETWTLSDLRREVRDNYPDGKVLAMLRAYPDRFGSGSPYSSQLAAREARFMAKLAVEHPFDERVKMLPALFIFTNDIRTDGLLATPDGRQTGDRYSYGAAASELLPRRDVTKVLLSTAELPLERFPIGAPMTVNLMAEVLKTKKGRDSVRLMVETYLFQGGTHIQINLADPEVLRDAQKSPEQYKDLLIRISGHTEPFIRLDKTMQDALIARAEMGC